MPGRDLGGNEAQEMHTWTAYDRDSLFLKPRIPAHQKVSVYVT